MIKKYKKAFALCVTVTFLALLPVYSKPLPAGQALNQGDEAIGNAAPDRNFVEKEQQADYRVRRKNILPIMIGITAVAAGVFLLVMLISKVKYDITGGWNFHNHYTTAGQVDFDSVWMFTSGDPQVKTIGTYVRYEADGSFTSGQYTVVNKKEVVFLDLAVSEQYVGQFDSKTTMSGTFILEDGKQGTWTAEKK